MGHRVPPRSVRPRGDRARDGLLGDQADGREGKFAACEMRQEFSDAASSTDGDTAPVAVDLYLPKVPQVQERIGCLDAPVPGMARADDAHRPGPVLVQDAQHTLFVRGQVSVARAETNVPAEVSYGRCACRLHGYDRPGLRGSEDRSARVYGCSGSRKSASAGAISTILPSFMTATRSHRCLTILRSCEMKR